MQISDYILLALIAFAAGLAVRKIMRDRRAGKCCGNCAGCTANCSAACAVHSDTVHTAHSDAVRTVYGDAANTARSAQNINHRAG